MFFLYLRLMLRLVLGLLFILSGASFFNPELSFMQLTDASGFPAYGGATKQFWDYGLAGISIVGGLFLLIGMSTRTVAIILATALMATAVLSYNFWTLTGLEAEGIMMLFIRNVVLSVLLLYLLVQGAGKFALDNTKV